VGSTPPRARFPRSHPNVKTSRGTAGTGTQARPGGRAGEGSQPEPHGHLRPPRPGADLQIFAARPRYRWARVVIQVGERSTVKAGDRVAWEHAPLSYADLVAVPGDRLIPIPETVIFEAAPGVLMWGLTAHYLSRVAVPVSKDTMAVGHSAGTASAHAHPADHPPRRAGDRRGFAGGQGARPWTPAPGRCWCATGSRIWARRSGSSPAARERTSCTTEASQSCAAAVPSSPMATRAGTSLRSACGNNLTASAS
jgi:hypothetical protein